MNAAEDDDALAAVGEEQGTEETQGNPTSVTQTGLDQFAAAGSANRTTAFGRYTEHPVAALFPLLRDVDDKAFAELVCSIRDMCGLLEPIVLDGEVILDGRNRYLACVAAGVEPRFVQFADLGLTTPAHEYAFERNYTRRHLTDDQRTAITAAFLSFDADEVKRKQAEAGKQGGRGNKKNPPQDSGEGLSSHKRTTHTLEKVATSAKVSKHKAQQAINLVQHGAPEQVQAVIAGKVKLKDAMPKATVTDAGARVGLDATAKRGTAPADDQRRAMKGRPRKTRGDVIDVVAREVTPSAINVDDIIQALKAFAEFCQKAEPVGVGRTVEEHEVDQVLQYVNTIYLWLSPFVESLPQKAEDEDDPS